MLLPGRYEYVRGQHKGGKPSGHRAFRQNIFFPVWRSVDNDLYDPQDKVDLGADSSSFVWDNLHSAYAGSLTGLYSSAGCQVIFGDPKSPKRNNAPETGPWRVFVENAYTTFQQPNYVYMLFDASELALVSQPSAQNLPRVARYGSSGPLVAQLQQALVAAGDLQGAADGEFGRNTLAALLAYQKRIFGSKAADGVLGVNTAASLGINLPTLGAGVATPAPVANPVTPASEQELEDETDLDPVTVQDLIDAFFGRKTTEAPGGTGGATTPPPPANKADISWRNFERSQELVREFEGGYVDDPKDPGGATNFGITIATYAKWKGRSVSKSEVANMSYDDAKKIYFENYWSYSSCGEMPGPLGLCIYNISVHGGPGLGATILQKALNKNGANVAVDGGIGGETLGAVAVKTLSLPDLIDDVIDLYDAKLRAHKNYEHFAKGFQRRVSLLRAAAEKWLAEEGTAAPALPTPKLDIQGDEAVTQASDNLIKEILGKLTQGQVNSPGQTTGASSDSLSTLLTILDTLKQSQTQPPGLTPVNGALGAPIGKLLDGRKSALGIIGSVLSTILLPAGTMPTGTSLAGAFPAILGPLSTVTPSLLPIFLALTVWGYLGKQEKNAQTIANAEQKKPPIVF